MSREASNPEPIVLDQLAADEVLAQELEAKLLREQRVARLRLFWEQRRFLGRVVAAGLAVAAALAFLVPKRYDSTARLMPPDDQSGTGMALMAALSSKAGGLSSVAGDVLGLKSNGELFIGILHSRTMENRLADQFRLQQVYHVSGNEDVRKKLAENTSISEDRLSGIITLTVSDRDPRRAAALANAYIDSLNSMVSGLSTSAARRERIFLEERLRVVRQNLEEAEQEFSQFASKNTAIDIPEQGKAAVTAAAVLQGQMIAAESELEGLKQIYSDNNVRVRAATARVNELQRQLERIGGINVNPGGDGKEEQTLYPSIRKLSVLGVTYADLYRKTKVQEAVFEALTQEHELAKVEEAKEIPSIKVLDPPNIPERKSFPPRLFIMLAGVFLSLIFGVVWVLGSTHWTRIDSQDPAKRLVQEIAATIKERLPRTSRNGTGQGDVQHGETGHSEPTGEPARKRE